MTRVEFNSSSLKLTQYRVTLVVEYFGWVDFDLGSSSGWWAATTATYCPGSIVQHPKSMSTQPRSQTTMVTLYTF